jgi:hypothetical protein
VRLLVFHLRHPVCDPVHHVPVVLFEPWLALFGHDPTSLSASRSWSFSLTVHVSDIHRPSQFCQHSCLRRPSAYHPVALRPASRPRRGAKRSTSILDTQIKDRAAYLVYN